MRTQQEGGICKPRREAPEETEPADTLIRDCEPLELQDNTFLLFKPHTSLWDFVWQPWQPNTVGFYEIFGVAGEGSKEWQENRLKNRSE